jgi:short-subunit dehydrogenase
MLFGIDVIIIAPGAVKTPIWDKAEEVDISPYKNSPYLPMLEKIRAVMLALGANGLPPEAIAEKVFGALTLPKPKVRYVVAPDRVQLFMASVLPKRMLDRIIAKRLGLTPQE